MQHSSKSWKRPARIAYSPGEAADSLGVSRPYIYELIKEGKLSSFKLGRRRLIPAESLQALADECLKGAA